GAIHDYRPESLARAERRVRTSSPRGTIRSMPPRTPVVRALLAILAALALALTTVTLGQTPSAPAPPSWVVRPGTNQVEVLDAAPGLRLRLLHGATPVAPGTVD